MELWIQLLVMFAFGGICAAVANSRGRTPVGWFFVGFIGGCLGLIILLVLPDQRILDERHQHLSQENRRLREMVRKDRMVADQRHGESVRRMGAHDRALGLDTASPQEQQIGPGAPEPSPDALDFVAFDWHYLEQGAQLGPVEFGTLRTFWKAGRLNSETHVWCAQMNEWLPIRDVRGMESALNA